MRASSTGEAGRDRGEPRGSRINAPPTRSAWPSIISSINWPVSEPGKYQTLFASAATRPEKTPRHLRTWKKKGRSSVTGSRAKSAVRANGRLNSASGAFTSREIERIAHSAGSQLNHEAVACERTSRTRRTSSGVKGDRLTSKSLAKPDVRRDCYAPRA